MKPISFLIACTYILTIFIIFPYVFILLNILLSLPILDNTVIKTVGLVLGVTAILFVTYCYTLFLITGKGSPIPTNPTKVLMEKSLYRYSRNPIYISHILLIFAGTLFLGYTLLFVYTFLCVIGYNWYIIKVEEPELKKRFGDTYSEYCKRVPRWL